MQEIESEILQNVHRGGGYFTLTLQVSKTRDSIQPGNFMMLSVGDEPNILLRRPMAFYDVRLEKTKTEINILYSVTGRGTQILSQKRPGESLSFLGPLGNSFAPPKKNEKIAVL